MGALCRNTDSMADKLQAWDNFDLRIKGLIATWENYLNNITNIQTHGVTSWPGMAQRYQCTRKPHWVLSRAETSSTTSLPAKPFPLGDAALEVLSTHKGTKLWTCRVESTQRESLYLIYSDTSLYWMRTCGPPGVSEQMTEIELKPQIPNAAKR